MSALILRGRLLRRPWTILTVVLVVSVLAAVFVALEVSRTSSPSGASSASVAVTKPPVTLVSSTPANGAANVQPDSNLSVSFNTSLKKTEPLPTISPAVPGTWVHTSSRTLTFQPTSSLPPGGTEQVTVPGGSGGIVGANGSRLPQATTVSFTVAPMSILRVQEILAQLSYMPLAFVPSGPAPSATEAAEVQPGSFAWRWTTLPAQLTSLWSEGQSNVITTGAVMAFEDDHNLTTDGVPGPQVWSTLLSALSAGQVDSYGHYDFVEVSTALPESVDVWRDGGSIYSSPANTGIESAPTELGTWPVYARFTSTTMTGTNPDGSTYDDPGVPWVSYFHGGDALHGFERSSYGYPQSLGCVEMPPDNAAVVFPLTPIGTLVTVS